MVSTKPALGLIISRSKLLLTIPVATDKTGGNNSSVKTFAVLFDAPGVGDNHSIISELSGERPMATSALGDVISNELVMASLSSNK